MNSQTNQTGFSAITLVLIVVVVAVISSVGYYVWHNSQTKPTISVTKTTVVANKPDTNTLKAGLSQYCAPIEKACFKYPYGWTLQQDESYEPAADRVTVTSPSGTKVTYNSGVTGIGGGCDPSTDIHVFVTKADVQKNVSGLYVVSTGKGDMTTTNIGLSSNQDKSLPTVGDTGQCLYYTIFTSHHDATLGAWLQVSKIGASSDIPVIENIMQSYYYQ